MKEYLKLKNLHSLFERNFFLLNSLVIDFDKNKKKVFEIPIKDQNKKVSINTTKLSNYTFDIELNININAVEEKTTFKVRVYLEAKMAEVISLQGFHNNLIDIIPTIKKFVLKLRFEDAKTLGINKKIIKGFTIPPVK